MTRIHVRWELGHLASRSCSTSSPLKPYVYVYQQSVRALERFKRMQMLANPQQIHSPAAHLQPSEVPIRSPLLYDLAAVHTEGHQPQVSSAALSTQSSHSCKLMLVTPRCSTSVQLPSCLAWVCQPTVAQRSLQRIASSEAGQGCTQCRSTDLQQFFQAPPRRDLCWAVAALTPPPGGTAHLRHCIGLRRAHVKLPRSSHLRRAAQHVVVLCLVDLDGGLVLRHARVEPVQRVPDHVHVVVIVVRVGRKHLRAGSGSENSLGLMRQAVHIAG